MSTQLYIGIMSGTSMDGADAVLIRTQGSRWLGAEAHAFTPYSDTLKAGLLDLQKPIWSGATTLKPAAASSCRMPMRS